MEKFENTFDVTTPLPAQEDQDAADQAEATAKALFSGEGDDANMPCTELTAEQVGSGMAIMDLLSACKLIPTRSEGRRLIEQGGISVDGEKITSFDTVISVDSLTNGVKIKKGKKIFHRAIIK